MTEYQLERCPACGAARARDTIACLDCGACDHGYSDAPGSRCRVCGRDRSKYNGPDPKAAEHVRRFHGYCIPSVGDLRLDNRAPWRSDLGNSDNHVSELPVEASDAGAATLTVDPDDFIPGPRKQWAQTTITKLPGGYEPRQPLKVAWCSHAGGALVRWWPLDLWATGVHAADAIFRLQDRIVELCQDFDSGRQPPNDSWRQNRRRMRAWVRRQWDLRRPGREVEPEAGQPSKRLDHEVTQWGNEQLEVHVPFTVQSWTSPRGGTRVGEAAWIEPQIFVEAGDEQTALDKLMATIEQAFLHPRPPRDTTEAELSLALNSHLRRGPAEVTGGEPIEVAKVPPPPHGQDSAELTQLKTVMPLVAAARRLYTKQENVLAAMSARPSHTEAVALVQGIFASYGQIHAAVRRASGEMDIEVDCSKGPVTVNLPLRPKDTYYLFCDDVATGWDVATVRDNVLGRGWELLDLLTVRTRQCGSGALVHWPPFDLWALASCFDDARCALLDQLDQLVQLHPKPTGLSSRGPESFATKLYRYVRKTT